MTFFSIIIPCFNEEAHIEKCLLSLNKQTLDRNKYEIIVIDNGSTDRSVQISRNLSDQLYIESDLKVGGVRNFGASKAKGNYLIFIDADCTLDNSWLERAKEFFETNGSWVVFGGGCSLPPSPVWIEKYWLLEGANGSSLPKDLIGCSIGISRVLFEKLGGFNSSLLSGEDSELSRRIKLTGKNIIISNKFNVMHWGNARSQIDFIKRQVWHAQSYKKNIKNNFRDPVFILILCFSLSFLTSITLFLISVQLGIFALIASMAIPATLTVKRYKRSFRKPENMLEPIKSYYIDLLYIISRIIGLILRSK
ncbi:MAG TPA: glycosyltransferase [Marinobacter sp.]|uniref:glycosyltransferase n=1 Tax=Marinobacter sp. TaxID=50741 RepID=UPI002D7FD095|nr:glycosyltransferase [Marinobacter sp.]HET8800074.1 glycosyltransferase [Marinobacter sp.]